MRVLTCANSLCIREVKREHEVEGDQSGTMIKNGWSELHLWFDCRTRWNFIVRRSDVEKEKTC